ncbi:cytochrome P450 [Thelephora ganbajun]|uniref:Cytochrome P450 n=1 Tax=Thelephora ganbajun TaxID=370292 RepID=A0ACB6ZEY3_THEGA|nr:cytochrome P450 [Thelephora ganbajun]
MPPLHKLPPGPSFILGQLLSWEFTSFVASVCLVHAGNEALGLNVPAWVILSCSILALPCILFAHAQHQYWRDGRKAASLGARLAPTVPMRLPGGVDLIATWAKAFNTGYIGDALVDWLAGGGQTVDLRTLWTSRIVTTEPQYIKMILSTNFDEYEKGEVQQAMGESLFGTGIFLSNGDRWKFHRSMTRSFFSRERISDFEIFNRHADKVVIKMKERFSRGIAVDVQDVLFRFTLDTATEFLFGRDVKSLSAELPYPSTCKSHTRPTHPSDEFALAFNRAQEHTFPRAFYGKFWPLLEFWKDAVTAERNITDKFINPLIEAALEKKNANGVDELDKEEGSLLDHLVRQTDDYDMIRDETFNIMLAGRDTTAGLTTFTVAMLAKHPEIYARLRREVLDTLGPDGKVDPDNLRDMKYLRAVLNETLRLYPNVPLNLRSTRKGVLWPSVDGGKPIYIPANTQLNYSPWLMHRRTDLWGPTAHEFDPDRFLDDRVKQYLVSNPFIFLPFNAGPRICLGPQFAYNEASTVIARIAQAFEKIEFDMGSNPEAKPPADWANGTGRKAVEKIWVRSHITIYAQGGVWVRMEEADPE